MEVWLAGSNVRRTGTLIENTGGPTQETTGFLWSYIIIKLQSSPFLLQGLTMVDLHRGHLPVPPALEMRHDAMIQLKYQYKTKR